MLWLRGALKKVVAFDAGRVARSVRILFSCSTTHACVRFVTHGQLTDAFPARPPFWVVHLLERSFAFLSEKACIEYPDPNRSITVRSPDLFNSSLSVVIRGSVMLVTNWKADHWYSL